MKAVMHNLSDEVLRPTGRTMYCRVCGGRYSASAGDYWYASANHVFTCCGQAMELVYVETHIVPA